MIQGVHSVCCKDPAAVEERKKKMDGKWRAESSVKSFEEWQRQLLLDNPGPKFEASLTEVVASVKKMKVKSERRKKSSKAPEVD